MCGIALPKSWEAHHIKRFADGGVTEINNGMALCRPCHLSIHSRRVSVNKVQARGWQEDALSNFIGSKKKSFLVNATPGAGKTVFSGLCARHMIDSEYVDFVVVVVPTTALKGDRHGGFLADWTKCGVDLAKVLSNSDGHPKDFNGGLVTYQQLPNIVSTFKTWNRNGVRLMFVFDEVHHASEHNKWGMAADQCGDIADRILCMSGTPFRGDGKRIAFIDYQDTMVDGNAVTMAKADYSYSYREAVRDRVCRELVFIPDVGKAEYRHKGEIKSIDISDADQNDESFVAKTIFGKDSAWLEKVIARADAQLDEYRLDDPDAAGIVICRPGNDGDDDRHLMNVRAAVRKVTGEAPEIITHDDPDADVKISRFRDGNKSGRWICSVRKISEGVDIKRLRVMVMASNPSTELLFRQMVGRVVRHEDKSKPEDATVYMAGFSRLKDWASRIEAEAKAGLSDDRGENENKIQDGGDGDEKPQSDFLPLGSEHQAGGGISSTGEVYTAEEIEYAESLKRGDYKLSFVSATTLAHINRKLGVEPKLEEINIPKHDAKLELRKEIGRTVKQIAIAQSPQNPDFPGTWSQVNKRCGVNGIDDLMDNYDIPKMQHVLEVVKSMKAGGFRNAA